MSSSHTTTPQRLSEDVLNRLEKERPELTCESFITPPGGESALQGIRVLLNVDSNFWRSTVCYGRENPEQSMEYQALLKLEKYSKPGREGIREFDRFSFPDYASRYFSLKTLGPFVRDRQLTVENTLNTIMRRLHESTREDINAVEFEQVMKWLDNVHYNVSSYYNPDSYEPFAAFPKKVREFLIPSDSELSFMITMLIDFNKKIQIQTLRKDMLKGLEALEKESEGFIGGVNALKEKLAQTYTPVFSKDLDNFVTDMVMRMENENYPFFRANLRTTVSYAVAQLAVSTFAEEDIGTVKKTHTGLIKDVENILCPAMVEEIVNYKKEYRLGEQDNGILWCDQDVRALTQLSTILSRYMNVYLDSKGKEKSPGLFQEKVDELLVSFKQNWQAYWEVSELVDESLVLLMDKPNIRISDKRLVELGIEITQKLMKQPTYVLDFITAEHPAALLSDEILSAYQSGKPREKTGMLGAAQTIVGGIPSPKLGPRKESPKRMRSNSLIDVDQTVQSFLFIVTRTPSMFMARKVVSGFLEEFDEQGRVPEEDKRKAEYTIASYLKQKGIKHVEKETFASVIRAAQCESLLSPESDAVYRWVDSKRTGLLNEMDKVYIEDRPQIKPFEDAVHGIILSMIKSEQKGKTANQEVSTEVIEGLIANANLSDIFTPKGYLAHKMISLVYNQEATIGRRNALVNPTKPMVYNMERVLSHFSSLSENEISCYFEKSDDALLEVAKKPVKGARISHTSELSNSNHLDSLVHSRRQMRLNQDINDLALY